MGIFEKLDPDAKRQRDTETALKSKREDRAKLVERLGLAEAGAANYKAKAREAAASGGDDAAISAIESKMRACVDRSATLIGAFADTDAAIVKLTAEIEAIVDRRARSETSAAVTALANQGDEVLAALMAAALAFETWAREAGLIVPEGVAADHFVRGAREQLPAITTLIVGTLQGHAKGVLSGHLPASLPRPAQPAPQLTVVPAAPPTQEVFMMRACRYLDPQRGQVPLGAYRVFAVPMAIAERALETGAAIPVTDPRRRNLQGTNGMIDPELQRCFALDNSVLAEPKNSSAPPIASSSTVFEPHPDYVNAQPKTFTVPRGSEPIAMGARSLPEDEQQS